MQELIQIFCATLGTLGFALLFRVRREHLLFATLGGALSWTAYLAVGFAGAGVFLSSLTGGVAVCLWSEMMARWRKAPANVYLIPGIVPLLPGSALYYAHCLRDRPLLPGGGPFPAQEAAGERGGHCRGIGRSRGQGKGGEDSRKNLLNLDMRKKTSLAMVKR